MSMTFIAQASNSTWIHNCFTIEAEVGDFYMGSLRELHLKPDLICIFVLNRDCIMLVGNSAIVCRRVNWVK